MKLLILMLKELIEMTEIMQFWCYFKFGMGLYKLMCKILWQFLVLLLFASMEARKKAALLCINATIRSLQKVPIVRSNTYDFFLWLRIGKVLIQDKSMYLTSNYIRSPIIFEKQCIACN